MSIEPVRQKNDTDTKIEELYEDPDMAVVIVMDISKTMLEDFGTATKFEAAMDAADDKAERAEAKEEKATEKEPKGKTSIRGKIKEGQEKAAVNAQHTPAEKTKATPER